MTTSRKGDRSAQAEEAIRRGGVTLAFDTNCVIGRNKDGRLTFPFTKLANAVENLRWAPTPHRLAIVIPTPVYFEVLHDLRIDRNVAGQDFDARVVVESLRSKNVQIEPFDAEAAVDASGQLFQWYPSEEQWKGAKGASRGATIDWLIATS